MNTSRLIRKLAFSLLLAIPVEALAAPKVVTSIRPVQALVYAVTGEANLPDVLLEPGTSPHAFSLKPSQAQMLQNADIVFWIGPTLETALEGPLQSLGADAHVVRLIDAPGLDLLHYNVDEHEDEAGHDHGPVDPHVWLSPANAMVLIDWIEMEMARLAPDHAAIYAKNANLAKNRLKLLAKQMDKILAHTRGVAYLVQHDGFGYIARDFTLNEVGSLQTMPGREPGAKHIAEMRDTITSQGVACIFVEPQFTPALAQRLKEETGVRLGELDPMGGALDLSTTLHVRIIQQVVLKMDECLFTKPVDATGQQ